MQYFLFVDDTNFNKNGKSKILAEEKATMVGCLVSLEKVVELKQEISSLQDYLYTLTGEEEFHFTDIYNRRGVFKGLEANAVLGILNSFAELINKYDIKIITQTITEEFLNKQENYTIELDRLINILKINNNGNYRYEAYALITNILRANHYTIKQDGQSRIVAVCCDEGLKKAGTGMKLPISSGTVDLCFESSKDEECLQIADYAAWALSRIKQTLNKSQHTQMKEFEQCVLSILTTIQDKYVNLPKTVTNVNNGLDIDEEYNKLVNKKSNI